MQSDHPQLLNVVVVNIAVDSFILSVFVLKDFGKCRIVLPKGGGLWFKDACHQNRPVIDIGRPNGFLTSEKQPCTRVVVIWELVHSA
jgi:hypothetical protein